MVTVASPSHPIESEDNRRLAPVVAALTVVDRSAAGEIAPCLFSSRSFTATVVTAGNSATGSVGNSSVLTGN